MDAYERIEAATEQCQLALDGVSAGDFGTQTPCDEFKLKDLLNHVIGGMSMLKEAASGGKPAMPDGELVSDDPAGQYKAARAELLGILKDPAVFDKTWEMPFGAMPGKMMAGIAFLEHLTHAWDVRKTIGMPTELPEALVTECMGVVQPMEQMLRMPGVCGPAVEVPESASVTDRFVGFMGRTP